MDPCLVKFINRSDQKLELLLENIGSSEVKELKSGFDRNLLRKFQKELVDEVRVLDNDGNLSEEVVMGHLELKKKICLHLLHLGFVNNFECFIFANNDKLFFVGCDCFYLEILDALS
jgi:hypothetical protein